MSINIKNIKVIINTYSSRILKNVYKDIANIKKNKYFKKIRSIKKFKSLKNISIPIKIILIVAVTLVFFMVIENAII